MISGSDETPELEIGSRMKFPITVSPAKFQTTGVERVVAHKQLLTVFLVQFTAHQPQVNLFIGSVYFIGDDRMTNVRQVNANLMLASRDRFDVEQRKLTCFARESPHHAHVRLRRDTIGTNTILDRHGTALVFAERRINGEFIASNVTIHDGAIFFVHRAGLDQFAQSTSDVARLGDQTQPALFTIEPIYQSSFYVAEIKPDPANEARTFVRLRGMTNQSRRFVQDQ